MEQIQVKLEDLWDAEQSILDAIHQVCTENGLRYSLAYGTLIGAVRHGGFIPWDDDIDVMMPREDYDQLIRIWNDASPKGFILETEDSSDDYINNFAKIRKDHTTFLQFENERNAKHHKGIYVDIFPADRRAPGKMSGKIQFAAFTVNLLFNRGYSSGATGMTGALERLLLRIVPRSKYRMISNAAGRFSRRWNTLKNNQLVFPCTIRSCRKSYPPEMFNHLRPMEFRGKIYQAFEDYDTVLRVQYGDYMQLPPEDERVWKHRPILVDFEHNYEELPAEKP